MKLALDHWHIEVSSICTLKCPRCPRAEVADTLLNRQLNLDFFKQQIGLENIQQLKKITFCGNDGDPIYCKEFLEICTWIKQVNPTVSLLIVTNGSYRKADWWQSLGDILNERDEVHWSLDGWDQESNQKYRVNCDWPSIIQGITAFTKTNNKTYMVWASIAFKFNQDNLDQQQALAKELGFDLYQLTKSTKFGSKLPTVYGNDDALEPTDPNLVSTNWRFQRQSTALSNKVRPGQEIKMLFLQRAQDLDKHNTASGLCLIGNKGIFINSRGELYPCSWTANRYSHNRVWHELAQNRFNLHKNTLDTVLLDPFWNNEFLAFDSQECRDKCKPELLKDIIHVTES